MQLQFSPEPIKCPAEPSVVSDDHNYDIARFEANRTFTNTDKSNESANWIGTTNNPAHFVYDIGCKALLSKLILRNSCNGAHKDR